MRARIRNADYEMEYHGPARLWNDALRPIFGGPEAPQGGGAADDATPRGSERDAPPPGRDDGTPDQDASAWERLARSGGRRGEKDAVLLAVFELGGAERDVSFDEVARVVHSHGPFRDVRVKPHLLKHVNRTKTLHAGASRQRVRLTPKGRRHVRGLLE